MKWLEFLEAERLKFVWASLAGSAFYGLYHLAALVLAGHSPTRTDFLRALGNIACAVVAGALVGYFLGTGLSALIPWPALRDASAIGFAIGAFGWELTPLAFRIAKQRAEKLGGGQ